MDLRQLEMFQAVAENGSFTKASRRLHVAQSAISRKVGMLEEEVGALLFKRVNRRIFLTPAGETLLRYTRRVFKDLDNALLEVSEIGQLKRGRLAVGAGMIACIYTLPPILERFKESYPDVELEVVTGSTESLIQQLRDNKLDLGLFTLPVERPDLKVIPLYSEEIVVVCSHKHRSLRRRKSLKAVELAEYPLVLFQRGTYTRRILDQFFEKIKVEPKISMAAENVATMKPLIQINLGVGLLPYRSVQDAADRQKLHVLRIRDYALTRDQGIVFHKSVSHPRVLRELISFFEETKDQKFTVQEYRRPEIGDSTGYERSENGYR